jgi:hypothetical protein
MWKTKDGQLKQGIKEKLVSENNFMNIYLIANIE